MWSATENCLFWLDNIGKRIYRLHSATGRVETRVVPFAPSAIYPHVDGGCLLVTKKGLALFDFSSGAVRSIPVTAIDFSRERFNDGVCDPRGRLWIGTRDADYGAPNGGLYCVMPDLSVIRHETGFVLSNGIALSPDGRTMYHVETRPGRIDALDIDVAAGQTGNRRVLVTYPQTADGPSPDGCTVDAEGGLWVAEVRAGRVVRFLPDGRFDREVRLPVSKPTSVMFGGAGLSTLFITSMRFGLTETQLADEPGAGGLLAVDVGVRGLPEYAFGSAASGL